MSNTDADAQRVHYLAAFDPTVRVRCVTDAFHFAGRDWYYEDELDMPSQQAAVLLDKGYVRRVQEPTANDRESLVR